jgi:hypothetical protein
VGRFSEDDPEDHGFILDQRGRFQRIDVPGASITALTDVNASGTSVGLYSFRDNQGNPTGHGFVRPKDGSIVTLEDSAGPEQPKTARPS